MSTMDTRQVVMSRPLKSVVCIPDESNLQNGHLPEPVPQQSTSGSTDHPPVPPGYEEPIAILLLGHSYVTRFINAQLEWMTETGDDLEESVNIEDEFLRLEFKGRPGLQVNQLFELMAMTQGTMPSIIILEIAQNDLCWRRNNINNLAQNFYEEVQFMLHIYSELEMVVVCQVLKKHKMGRGDKSKEKLNEDIEKFNLQFLRLTRKDTRVMSWRHKNLEELTAVTSTDGTHPNTIGGYWTYLKSIAGCCKYSKREMILRRGKSHRSIEKRKLAMRRQRAQRRKKRQAFPESESDEDNEM